MNTNPENLNGTIESPEERAKIVAERIYVNNVLTSLTSYLTEIQYLRSKGSSHPEIVKLLKGLDNSIQTWISDLYLIRITNSVKELQLDTRTGAPNKLSLAVSKELSQQNG